VLPGQYPYACCYELLQKLSLAAQTQDRLLLTALL